MTWQADPSLDYYKNIINKQQDLIENYSCQNNEEQLQDAIEDDTDLRI